MTLFRMVGIRLFCKRERSVLFYNASVFIISVNNLTLWFAIKAYSSKYFIWSTVLANDGSICDNGNWGRWGCNWKWGGRAVSVFWKKSNTACSFLVYFCARFCGFRIPLTPLSQKDLAYTQYSITSWSRVKCTNHQATVPPSSPVMLLLIQSCNIIIITTNYTSGGMTKSDESQTCTPPYSASGLLLLVKFVRDSPFTFVVTEL